MKKDIQAIVADIDGTLVCKGEEMLPKTKEALERLHEQGVLIGVATGRPLDRRILDKPKEWGLNFDFDVAIGMNGGELWDKDHDYFEKYHLLKKEDLREILEFLKDFDMNALVYDNGYEHISCLRMDEFMQMSIERNKSHVVVSDIDGLCSKDTGKLEVHYNLKDRDKILKKIEEHKNGRWLAVETYRGTVEFQDARVNKGLGLEKYVQRNNLDLDKVIGFGDMDNDIGLLKTAGWGVCLKNGSDETKAVANEITKFPVEEDGVGKYLFENVLD